MPQNARTSVCCLRHGDPRPESRTNTWAFEVRQRFHRFSREKWHIWPCMSSHLQQAYRLLGNGNGCLGADQKPGAAQISSKWPNIEDFSSTNNVATDNRLGYVYMYTVTLTVLAEIKTDFIIEHEFFWQWLLTDLPWWRHSQADALSRMVQGAQQQI